MTDWSERDAWLLSWALGVVVILMFAHDQLNRPLAADPDMRRRARILEMAAPAELRNAAMFWRGYAFYAALLVLAYTLLSVLGGSVLSLLVASGGSSPLEGAAAPLAVALMMVGFLPRTPFLDRLEERFRMLAYRLVGVPKTFTAFTEALLGVRLERDSLSAQLIGPVDRVRLNRVLDRAETALGAGTPLQRRFEQDAMKLFAFRAWTNDPDKWPGWTVRRALSRFELEIAPKVEAVVEDLEDLAIRDQAAAAPAAGNQARLRAVGAAEDQAEPGPAIEDAALLRRAADESRWRAVAARVSEAAEEACGLFALFAEQARSRPTDDNPVSAMLRELIERAEEQRADSRRPMLDVLLRMVLLLGGGMFLVGLIGQSVGFLVFEDLSALGAGALYAVGVVALYGPPSFMAWSARQDARVRRSWRPAFGEDVFPTGQYLMLFLTAWLVAAASLAGFVFVEMGRNALAAPDPAVAAAALFEGGALLWLAQYGLAYGLCGAWHATMLAATFDFCAERPARDGGFATLMVAQAVGLVTLSYIAAEWTGRIAGVAGDKTALSLPGLDAMETDALVMIHYEVAATALFGVLALSLTRRALVRLAALG